MVVHRVFETAKGKRVSLFVVLDGKREQKTVTEPN